MLDQLRLESYGCKLRVSTAVNILGLVWIIISFLSIIFGILVTADHFPFLFKPARNVYIAAGVIMIIIFLIMLVMNFFLFKRNRSGRFDGVKTILGIICKFTLSLLMIGDLILLCYCLALIIKLGPLLNGPFYQIVVILIVTFILEIVWLIFLSLGIHGIRKNRKSLINAYIIFNIVMLVLQIILQIIFTSHRNDPGSNLGGLVVSVVLSMIYFILHIGYFVVLYNIMDVIPEDDQEMKPV